MDDLPELALSVRQPWAWAILHAGKDVENRDWRRPNPGLAFRGRVAIHASSGMTRDEYDAVMPRSAPPIPPPHLLVRGAIIGHVQIMDIIRDPRRETIISEWFCGPVGLMLRDPVAIEPIPCAGALGFFAWRKNLTDAVSAPAVWMLPEDRRPGRTGRAKKSAKAMEPPRGYLIERKGRRRMGAPTINYDMLAARSELNAVRAERDRAQTDCARLAVGNAVLRSALLRMTAIIETQTEPDIDALHDVARDALNGICTDCGGIGVQPVGGSCPTCDGTGGPAIADAVAEMERHPLPDVSPDDPAVTRALDTYRAEVARIKALKG